jgi:predicted metallo-beta-lactamase superfamily hydrolase
MDKVGQELFEEINNNLKNLALFLDKLSKQEIEIDSSKISIIDYSQYRWLNLPENSDIRNQLEQYNQQSINDIINDDFSEFCRKIYLQIEILLNQFIKKKFGRVKTQNINYSKKSKLYDFFQEINGNKVNFKPYDYDEYKTISFIMDIRDVASHGDSNGKKLAERIEAKGKSIGISLINLKQDINQDTIKKLFIDYVANSNIYFVKVKIEIDDRKKLASAKVTLSNLIDHSLTVEKVIDKSKTDLKSLQYQFGNRVDVIASNNQFPNELKIFFEKQDYQQIKNTMNWFIEEIGKLIY